MIISLSILQLFIARHAASELRKSDYRKQLTYLSKTTVIFSIEKLPYWSHIEELQITDFWNSSSFIAFDDDEKFSSPVFHKTERIVMIIIKSLFRWAYLVDFAAPKEINVTLSTHLVSSNQQEDFPDNEEPAKKNMVYRDTVDRKYLIIDG